MVKKMCKVCKKEAKYLMFVRGIVRNFCLEHSKIVEKEFGEIEPLTTLLLNYCRQ